jgi:multiple antibiotic resistance protein
MIHFTEYAKLFAGLVAVVNPVGAIPIFISLTASQSVAQRRRTGTLAAVAIALVLWASLVVGEPLLGFFGISISSFRVAGGILILLMAISMLHAHVSHTRQTDEEAAEAADKDSVAVVPLAIPLLAGPGAISTVILYAHRNGSPVHLVVIAVDILIVAAMAWICFRAAPVLSRWLGTTGINVVTRIMGLIIAAIGVEFITNGLKQLLPGLS